MYCIYSSVGGWRDLQQKQQQKKEYSTKQGIYTQFEYYLRMNKGYWNLLVFFFSRKHDVGI